MTVKELWEKYKNAIIALIVIIIIIIIMYVVWYFYGVGDAEGNTKWSQDYINKTSLKKAKGANLTLDTYDATKPNLYNTGLKRTKSNSLIRA